jgi:hypothetical protein
MANINDTIRRYSSMIDTSGQEGPRGIQISAMMGGGVYPQVDSASGDTADAVATGRISLGLMAALIVAAVAFYLYTNEIQGGG